MEETKIEIDNFFQTAEFIKKGNKTLDPSKLAMLTILSTETDKNFKINLKNLN